jgi:hypothetical protein
MDSLTTTGSGVIVGSSIDIPEDVEADGAITADLERVIVDSQVR